MKDIKFRGMAINGEVHYGLLTILETDRAIVPRGSYISNSVGMPFAYQVRPETVGQYTGLKDKNGKEIYEGDILLPGWEEDEFFEVVFSEGSFRELRRKPGLIRNKIYIMDGSLMGSKLTPREVIGNIYENGDLLKCTDH